MLKKLFITATAAAAVSVPLAGVAWADKPENPGANGNGIGEGGIPAKTGTFLNNNYPGVEFGGTVIEGQPISPGEAFRVAAKTPCTASGTAVKCSTPDAYGEALTTFYNANGIPTPDGPAVPLPPGATVEIGRTIPGSVVRLFTPGCGKGGPRPQITVTAGGASQTVDAPCIG